MEEHIGCAGRVRFAAVNLTLLLTYLLTYSMEHSPS